MKILISFALSLLSAVAYAQNATKQAFLFAEKQTDVMLKEVTKTGSSKSTKLIPRTLDVNGNLVLIPSSDWVSGFFPGELWYLYEYTHNKKWLAVAKKYTAYIEPERYNKNTHDIGFMIYCPVGNGYRLTKNSYYKNVIIAAAKTLSTRFNPKVGCIKSWDNNKQWNYPVIIDNMMNLELLFEATKLSGDSSFYKIAVTHANNTLKNHFRPDHSSYHVVNYDPVSGKVLQKQTHQGYADESAWARGQAWALYGYTMCYRETKNPAYLKQAEWIAKYILNHPHLPEDKVPYWDFNAPDLTKAPRDASAAAIIASALYELSTYSTDAKKLNKEADKIINNLSTKYQPAPGGSKGFILLHSTGHKPAGSEVDVPIAYADYYYLEALLRQKRLANSRSAL